MQIYIFYSKIYINSLEVCLSCLAIKKSKSVHCTPQKKKHLCFSTAAIIGWVRKDAIKNIGLFAQRLPNVANTCLEGLLALTIKVCA